jgi:hypothetical protein
MQGFRSHKASAPPYSISIPLMPRRTCVRRVSLSCFRLAVPGRRESCPYASKRVVVYYQYLRQLGNEYSSRLIQHDASRRCPAVARHSVVASCALWNFSVRLWKTAKTLQGEQYRKSALPNLQDPLGGGRNGIFLSCRMPFLPCLHKTLTNADCSVC